VSYTRSKAEDRLNHWDPLEDSSDPELDRALAAADTPHNFVASATWNLPGSGFALSQWRLSGVLHAQSGNPYTIRYASDLTGTTLSACSGRGCGVTQPGARNTARGEAIQYLDMSIARTFTLAGVKRLEFRADTFNAFNNQN
jgi:hypothetical protein